MVTAQQPDENGIDAVVVDVKPIGRVSPAPRSKVVEASRCIYNRGRSYRRLGPQLVLTVILSDFGGVALAIRNGLSDRFQGNIEVLGKCFRCTGSLAFMTSQYSVHAQMRFPLMQSC